MTGPFLLPKTLRLPLGLMLGVFLLGSVHPLPAQVLPASTDQHPPSTRWKVITAPHVRIVLPAEILDYGQRAARLFERAYGPLAKSLGTASAPIALVLTNQGVESNGLVRLAPRMSEWFTTPPQSGIGGAVDWPTLLATHEGRHVVQFDKLNRGFTRAMSYAFGELGRAAFSLVSAPAWYLEGDAVGMETALTAAGRGRQPEFDMAIRALLLSGRLYSYDKTFLGSDRDYYPDYYHLGYLLTTHLRDKLGADVWSRILDSASRNSFWVFSFERALVEETGRTAPELYLETMSQLAKLWQAQLAGLPATPFRVINAGPRPRWTNYLFPQSQPDGSVICQKYGLDDPPALVRLRPDGSEKLLRPIRPLELFGTRSSARGGLVAWCEREPDARWGKRSYGVVVVLDLATGRARRLTPGSRYLNAVLDPRGRRLAAVEYALDGSCRVVVLDAETGKRLRVVPNPDNAYLFAPSWSEDGRRLAFARQSDRGRGLAVADLQTGSVRHALPDGPRAVSDPVFYRTYLLYHSPYSGVDNIYALDMQTGRRWQVTSVRFGAFHPEVSPDGSELLFNSYTADGFDVVKARLDPSTWRRIEDVERRDLGLYRPLVAQEQGGNIFAEEPESPADYPVSDYAPSSHWSNFHSWGLLPTATELNLVVLSNDVLNTTSVLAGLDWNYNERTLGFGLSLSYQALFPLLELEARYGGRTSTSTDSEGGDHRYGWREARLGAGFEVPLNLSRGVYSTFLTLGAGISNRRISDREAVPFLDQGNGLLVPLSYSLGFGRFRQTSLRDLRPAWGQHLALVFRHTPFGAGDFRAKLFSASAGAYLPGLFRHHSLHLEADYESQEPDNYRFESEFLFPRGYDDVFHRKLARLAVDYALPVAYPDAALGRYLYLKRLWVDFFYDRGWGRDPGRTTRYESAGLDLLLDSCLFRTPVTITLGLRLAYRFTDHTARLEPLILGFAF
jgi:hypothetical protein